MTKIIACCLSVLVAALAMEIMQLRAHNSTLAANVSAQAETITELTAKRDALQARADTACPVTLIPQQSDVEAVLEPLDEDAKSRTDALKKRYEDMLVTYFVLRQCGKNDVLDYHIIVSALSQEMASLQAPGRLQYDVLTSAQGSYKELYSGNACASETIDPLREKYQTFVDSVAAQFLPN